MMCTIRYGLSVWARLFLTMLQAGFEAYPFAKAATPFISTIQKVSVTVPIESVLYWRYKWLSWCMVWPIIFLLVIQSATHSHFDLFFPKRLPFTTFVLWDMWFRPIMALLNSELINLSNQKEFKLGIQIDQNLQLCKCWDVLSEKASLRANHANTHHDRISWDKNIQYMININLFVVCLFVFISADVFMIFQKGLPCWHRWRFSQEF